MMSLFENVGRHKNIVMEVEASSAVGIIERRGIGRIRQLQTSALWLQEQRSEMSLGFTKSRFRTSLGSFHKEHIEAAYREASCRHGLHLRRR